MMTRGVQVMSCVCFVDVSSMHASHEETLDLDSCFAQDGVCRNCSHGSPRKPPFA